MIWLLACADAELAPFSESLRAWEEGEALLAEGKPEEAAAAYARARLANPKSPEIAIAEAKALAAAGRLSDADQRLTEVLASWPTSGIAWYNRAAYRVRAGRPDDAASDLAQALRLEVCSPWEAAADPDFAAALGSPAFSALLPSRPVEASLAPPESVFLGSDLALVFTITSMPTSRVRIERAGADPGCLRAFRLVEDDQPGPGAVTRRVEVRFRAEGPCVANLGPFVVTDGTSGVELPAVPVRVEAPAGTLSRSDLPPLPSTFPVPGVLVGDDASTVSVPLPDGVAALGRADRPLLGDGRAPDITLEWRVESQTRAAGGWWRGPVTITGFEEAP